MVDWLKKIEPEYAVRSLEAYLDKEASDEEKGGFSSFEPDIFDNVTIDDVLSGGHGTSFWVARVERPSMGMIAAAEPALTHAVDCLHDLVGDAAASASDGRPLGVGGR